jgi:hypothetical protein
MEKTLVIHPYDPTTEFLRPIYLGLEGAVVLRGNYTKDYVRQMIEESDRVIMLGHGSPSGLFSIGKFQYCNNGLIIDESMVAALGRKKNNMYVWCNADQFVNRYHLNGFYSGMFISEYGEADYCRVHAERGEVEKSNNLFAEVVGKNVLKEAKELCFTAKLDYYIPDSEVNYYNNERLYWR